jgi:hypothetical protein
LIEDEMRRRSERRKERVDGEAGRDEREQHLVVLGDRCRSAIGNCLLLGTGSGFHSRVARIPAA